MSATIDTFVLEPEPDTLDTRREVIAVALMNDLPAVLPLVMAGEGPPSASFDVLSAKAWMPTPIGMTVRNHDSELWPLVLSHSR